MNLIIEPRFRICRNSRELDESSYTAWECSLTVRTSQGMNDAACHVFYGQDPLSAYHKAVVGLDVFLKSPEFIYPLVEEFIDRG